MSSIFVFWQDFPDNNSVRHRCWDMQIVEDLLEGTGYSFYHFDGHLPPDPKIGHLSGGVVSIPARYSANNVSQVQEFIDRLPWVVLLLTSDEESLFPAHALHHPNMRLWVQTPIPDHSYPEGTRFFPYGPPPGTREAFHGLPYVAARPVPYYFSGQVTHPRREEMARYLPRVRNGEFNATPGFTQGHPRVEYLSRFLYAKVAPSPSGPATPDSFRLWEALEAGCVPIVDIGAHGYGSEDFWSMVLDEPPPFPIVGDWAESPVLIRSLANDFLPRSTQVQSWYRAFMARLVRRLRDDIEEVSDVPSPIPPMAVLLLTSPIPSVPSTSIIEETLSSIRERTDAPILILADGVRPEQVELAPAYHEYVSRLQWLAAHHWESARVLAFPTHHHQAAMTREALKDVDSPAILFVEHDTPLVGDIPFPDLLVALSTGLANLIRLHHEASILDPHLHLMPDGRSSRRINGVPLTRTVQWSQRPHVARTDFYRRILTDHFAPNARAFIEDCMHGVVQEEWKHKGQEGWENYRMWMYTPVGDIKRSWHTDGRAGGEKYSDKQSW